MTTAKSYGATIHEDIQNGPNYCYTISGVSHTVWFQNANSIGSLLNVVNKYNIYGISIWYLGGEDMGIYPIIRTKF